VSHEGEAHRAEPGVMTFGEPAVGDLIAERYRLEVLVDTDAADRQIWRGIDLVLRRPVAIVIRQPGGEAAAGMLTTAVAASRLVHPHIVSVYDAIDEQHRAYLVREWVAGVALRDVLRQSPLDAERATLVTHAIAEAVAALHSAEIAHGNVHPGTILIADDGRVVLTDAHADGPVDPDADIRAVGAVLYACLTGLWPYAEAGHSTLPDAVRDQAGRLATPRQVRGGVPRHLDEIAAQLLDRQSVPPTAATIAAEFARLATQGIDESPYDGGYEAGYQPPYDHGAHYEYDYDDDHGGGPMGFAGGESGGRRRAGGKLALGVAALTVIALAGAFLGVKILGSNPDPGNSPAGQTAPTSAPVIPGNGQPIALQPSQIRIVDPPRGDRTEVAGSDKIVDGNQATGWSTDEYSRANFGGLKPGMGVLINLGTPTKVGAVKVTVSQQGASVSLRTGTTDPGNTSDGDQAIFGSYTVVGQALDDYGGTNMVFPVPAEQQMVQYLLVWINKLPADSNGKFVLSINEVSVLAP
jgi:hypothetical protein